MAFVAGQNSKVYLNGFDVSAYLNKFSLKGMADVAETSTFGATAKSYIGGLEDATLSLEGFFDGGVNAADAILTAAFDSDTGIFAVLPGGDAFGNRGYGMNAIEKSYEVTSDVGNAVQCTAEAQSKVGSDSIGVLLPLAARTATANGTGLDNTASTANGLVAYCMVTAASGTTPTLVAKVQHSTDNTTYTDLVSFNGGSNITAAPFSQRVTVAGTVNRYLRAQITIGGTTPSFTVWIAAGRL